MSQIHPQLIVIGLDGATFDVIDPLVKRGRLPHLARMMAEGARGTLESIIPPITGPAWTVLATGKNPGQLGVYDFVNRRRPDDFRLYPIRAQDFAGQTYWDVLNAQGYRNGILNYPMLVPAYPIDGWMVAGLGASKLHDYAYPAALKQTLDQVTGGYEINISYGLPKYQDNLPLLVADMKEMLHKRMQALRYLLVTDPVDILTVVFTVPDVASHTFWEYWERDDTAHADKKAAYISIWEAVDEAVGEVCSYLAPEGHVLVISDHGFGPSHGVFHVNQWLQEAGYLVRRRETPSRSNRLREWLIKRTTPILGPVYKRMQGSRAQQLLRASILREIDLTRSTAFLLDNSDGCGGVYINRLYARQNGLDEEEFVRSTAMQVKRDLLAYADSAGIAMDVWMADEIYSGDKVPLAPELLLTIDDHRCSISYRFEEPIYADRRHHPMKSGTHRMNGILIGTGPHIRPGASIEGAKLQDIAPTLLHLADAPLPQALDGRVLTELFNPEFRSTRAAAQAPEPAGVVPAFDVRDEDDEEQAVVLDRLRDLGYLE